MKIRKNVKVNTKYEPAIIGYHTDNGYRTEFWAPCEDCGEYFLFAAHENGAWGEYHDAGRMRAYGYAPINPHRIDAGDRFICPDCVGGYSFCDCCGAAIPPGDEINTPDGATYCSDDCARDSGWEHCEYCGEWVSEDDPPVAIDSRVYCSDECAERDGYRYCECCGEWVCESEWDYDHCCCCACSPDDDGVEEYHAKNDYHSVGEGMGYEIEVDGGSDPSAVVEIVDRYMGGLAHCEHDGSLSCGGVEIVTDPLTRARHSAIDWVSFFRELVDAGYLSHDAGTCGLHVHIDRDGYGIDDDAAARLDAVIAHHWDSFVALSRRTPAQLHWCDKAKGATVDAIKNEQKNGGRYRAVNTQTRFNTLEIRLGRGTLNPATFEAWIDICHIMAKNAKNIQNGDFALKKWFAGISEDTKKYIDKKSDVSW